MKSFFYLLQKCIKSKQFIYPGEPFEPRILSNCDENFTDISSYIYSMIYEIDYIFKQSKITNIDHRKAHSKSHVLEKYLNNIYISNELKEKIFNIYTNAQRMYFAFSKLTNLYKYKKYPIVVSNDLTFNPLDINHRSTYVILQGRSKYLFSINDLINIIETAISNSPDFFSQPLSPKNPYNGQEFNTSTLYNIYFKMKNVSCKFSLLLHLFFLDHFIKHNFLTNNEPFIREYSIKKYVYNSHSESLYNSVINMLYQYMYTNKLFIHDDFSKELLVNIFRPYLYYYYMINYSIIGTEQIKILKGKLYIKLHKFYEYNKIFGRKIYTIGRCNGFKSKTTFIFNTKHINFYN